MTNRSKLALVDTVGEGAYIEVVMQVRRILIGLIALVVLCGPLCSLPLAVASPEKEDCHKESKSQKEQLGIHSCCDAAVLPAVKTLSLDSAVALIDWAEPLSPNSGFTVVDFTFNAVPASNLFSAQHNILRI